MGRREYERGLRRANEVFARRTYEPLVSPEAGRAGVVVLLLISLISLLVL